MILTPVVSSNLVKAVHHDETTNILTVQLVYGERTHEGVTAELFQSMMSAPSIGSFYSKNIKNMKQGQPSDSERNGS